MSTSQFKNNQQLPSQSTVLIVDDTIDNLRLLSAMLKEYGYNVRVAINSELALNSIHIAIPDIILLDVNMPHINGFELCTRIKSNPTTEHIPIIFISAFDDTSSKITGFNVGGVDYITKPFQIDEVLARVYNQLSFLHVQRQLMVRNEQLMEEIAVRSHAEESLRYANQELSILVNEFERRNLEMVLLNHIGDFLLRAQTLDEAYMGILPMLRQLYANEPGALYVTSTTETTSFDMVISWGVAPPTQQHIIGTECLALQHKHIHRADDATANELCPHFVSDTHLHQATEHYSPYPYLCIPLASGDDVLGLLHVQHGPTSSYYANERWTRLSTMVADRITLSLVNLHLRQQLREQSIRDPLTRLYNRRYLCEILTYTLQNHFAQHIPVGFILFDIDHFKQYNDNYGHSGGDALLQTLSAFIQQHITQNDIACRYGGEEFLIILPDTTPTATHQIAEQLCHDVRAMHASYQGTSLGTVTISVGVALFPFHDIVPEKVIDMADEALYRAKRQGRNQVVCLPMPESTA